MSRAALSPLTDMIKVAIEAGLRVVEVVSEPDGTIRLLTKPQGTPVLPDPLIEARLKRETKGNGHANSH